MLDVVDHSLPIPWSGAIIKQLKYRTHDFVMVLCTQVYNVFVVLL